MTGNSEHFDAVVIGSGFGGSVMSYRLASAQMRVCLLERGKPYPPNSFARAPYDLSRNFWDPSEGLYGMFNVWSFRGSGAVVSSGLGGGSLIYANVLLRKDEAWFKEDLPDGSAWKWPIQYADLDDHYGAVERMMNAQRYPLAHAPYDRTPKTLAMQEAAAKLNPDGSPTLRWMPLNLAVSFRAKPVDHPSDDSGDNPPRLGEPLIEAHPNIHGMTRDTCRLCGECDLGCNYGSKNSLDYNYISAAHRHGADVRTLCEVKTIDALPSASPRFAVTYVQHDPERFGGQKIDTDDRHRFPRIRITCDRLILAAGTFGTSYLLFSNRAALPQLSPTLGTRYSVNGDLLSFIVNATRGKNGATVPRPLEACRGPVITGAIRYGDTLDGQGAVGRGFYVEDGGHPALLSWTAELSGIAGYLRRLIHFARLNLTYRFGKRRDTDLGAEIAALLGECITSRTSMPVLTMGRDCPTGRLKFDGHHLDCDWDERDSAPYYDRVEREVTKIATALGAKYVDNPAFKWNFHQVLSAHPLGGCPMGETAARGVVNADGEVFGYPGMYITDGSVMPGPVGANPSLTIAAFADRAADRIIAGASPSHRGSTA